MSTLADTVPYVSQPLPRRPKSLHFLLRLYCGPFRLRIERRTVLRTNSVAALAAEATRLRQSGSRVSVVVGGGRPAA